MKTKPIMVELATFRAFDGKEYTIKAGRGALPRPLADLLKRYSEIHDNPDLIRKGYFIEQLKEGWLKDTQILKIEEIPE